MCGEHERLPHGISTYMYGTEGASTLMPVRLGVFGATWVHSKTLSYSVIMWVFDSRVGVGPFHACMSASARKSNNPVSLKRRDTRTHLQHYRVHVLVDGDRMDGQKLLPTRYRVIGNTDNRQSIKSCWGRRHSSALAQLRRRGRPAITEWLHCFSLLDSIFAGAFVSPCRD